MRTLSIVFMFLALAGCREEPTIVIKFEPNDMAGAAAKPAARDAALAPAAAPTGSDCKVATDCVTINEDCCGCTAGGNQVAMTASAAQAHAAGLIKKCQGSMCTQMLSNDPSCQKVADCVAGRCVLTEKKAATPANVEDKKPEKKKPKK